MQQLRIVTLFIALLSASACGGQPSSTRLVNFDSRFDSAVMVTLSRGESTKNFPAPVGKTDLQAPLEGSGVECVVEHKRSAKGDAANDLARHHGTLRCAKSGETAWQTKYNCDVVHPMRAPAATLSLDSGDVQVSVWCTRALVPNE